LHQAHVKSSSTSSTSNPEEASKAFLGERAFAAHAANQPGAAAQLQAWAKAAAGSGLKVTSGASSASGNWMSDSSSSAAAAEAGAGGEGGPDARLPSTGEKLPQAAAEAQAGWWLITADHSPEVGLDCGCCFVR